MSSRAKLKRESVGHAVFAEGGSTKMLGKGDRTRTAPSDAANAQAPGVTEHKTSGRNLTRASGGPRMSGPSLSMPAKAGHTAPPRKGR